MLFIYLQIHMIFNMCPYVILNVIGFFPVFMFCVVQCKHTHMHPDVQGLKGLLFPTYLFEVL